MTTSQYTFTHRGEQFALGAQPESYELTLTNRAGEPMLVFEHASRDPNEYVIHTRYGKLGDLVVEGGHMLVFYHEPNRSRMVIGPVGEPFAEEVIARWWIDRQSPQQQVA